MTQELVSSLAWRFEAWAVGEGQTIVYCHCWCTVAGVEVAGSRLTRTGKAERAVVGRIVEVGSPVSPVLEEVRRIDLALLSVIYTGRIMEGAIPGGG